MFKNTLKFNILAVCLFSFQACIYASNNFSLSPSPNSLMINPDTHLELIFNSKPVLGHSGQIRIYDASDNSLVDLLDLSIPPGPVEGDTSKGAVYTPVPYSYLPGNFTNKNTIPGTPSGLALPTSDKYQLTIIGGFTDGFHFYPVIIKDNKATIFPHNNMLEYDKTYYVQVDPNVFSFEEDSFNGINGRDWIFSTKKSPPSQNNTTITVSNNCPGDFNTIQGALDYITDNCSDTITIFVKKGFYEEIVYFRNKKNINIIGEDRDNVIVSYANNEVFNPHPINIKTNEMPGTFPSRRAAFAADNCRNIRIENMTIMTTAKGQAEGLLLNGEQMFIKNVTIIGSGDALQTNGSAYFVNCLIIGDGDTVLGRGPAFFKNCELRSYGTFMWIRNTEANHGNIFVDCTFKTLGNGETEIARSPTNHGKNYPYCEAVLLNCKLSGISPEGWGTIGGDPSNVHYWEFNSLNLIDGKPINASKRNPHSSQLPMKSDSLLIVNYMNPAYILNGWNPEK